MRQFVCRAVIAVYAFRSAPCQTPPKPEFEVASIRLMPPPPPGARITGSQRGGPGTSDPGLFECGNCSLATLVMRAYDVRGFQFEAPQWLWAQQFLVTAKVPPGATKEQFQAMFQHLIEERFKLSYHRRRKEVDGYQLVIAKNGPKLQEHVAQPPPDRVPSPTEAKMGKDGFPDKVGFYSTAAGHKLRFNDHSMSQLAMDLTPSAGLPVVDATGLRGSYDITLSWSSSNLAATSAEPRNTDNESGITLVGALQSQLGLKLEAKRLTIDVLVVDSIEKAPTAN
jgi:uncharacterized protein (TIGR03435 family)